MKYFWMFLVQVIVAAHFAVVAIIVFGWLVPAISYLYGFTLFATMASWLFLKRCALLDIENFFRKQYGEIAHTDSGSFIVTWFTRWFGEKAPSDRFIVVWGGLFLVVSFSVWVADFWV